MTLTSKESVDKLHGVPFTIRKISSEDDVGSLPRSHYTPKVISVYADSIRRQRSDSFVHSYNHHHHKSNSNNYNTHQIPTATRTLSTRRPIHTHLNTDDDGDDSVDKPDPTSGDSTNDRSGFLTVNNININNIVDSSSRSSSIRNSGGSYHSRPSTPTATPPSLHINTSSSTTSNGKNDNGAILEGVLIRRAIRPGSHLAHQQQKATAVVKDDLITPSSSPKDEGKETLTYSPTPITNTATTTAITQNGGIISPVSSTLDSSIPPPTPWQPPSLTTPHPNNLTISSMTSPPPLDDDATTMVGSVVSKMLPRKDKSMEDYSKHPSLFKRLAQRHHNHGPRLYREDAMASSSPSATVIMDQDTEL